MATATPLENLLTCKQAAEFLNTTPGTLAVWRCNRRVAIPYIKLGKSVKYRVADIERFIQDRVVGGESADSE